MFGIMTGTAAKKSDIIDIPNVLMNKAADIISYAWKELTSRYVNDEICKWKEDEITQVLCNILGELYENPPSGFDWYYKFFQTPIRGSNIENFDNTHINKQPDLAFRPQRGSIQNVVNSSTVAIFIECKPITRNHSLKSKYCEDGLIRFINGDYSWQVNKAMMIGYVKNNKRLPIHLKEALDTLPLTFSSNIDSVYTTQNSEKIYSTIHKRCFSLGGTIQPGEIRVNHLWLKTLEECEAK